jgi:hypothetical protein
MCLPDQQSRVGLSSVSAVTTSSDYSVLFSPSESADSFRDGFANSSARFFNASFIVCMHQGQSALPDSKRVP